MIGSVIVPMIGAKAAQSGAGFLAVALMVVGLLIALFFKRIVNAFNNGCRDTMQYNMTLAILIALVSALFMTATGVYWMAWALLLGAGTLFLIKQRRDDVATRAWLQNVTFTEGKQSAICAIASIERERPSYAKNIALSVLRELVKVS